MRASGLFAESSELIVSAMGPYKRGPWCQMTNGRLLRPNAMRCQERLGGLLKYYHREAA